MIVNPYDVLGVPCWATQDEIHNAYRRLAKQWHPDLNPGDKQAEERFKKIVNAYDLISSAEKGILLDQAGFDNGDSAEPFSATASYTADATFTTRRCSDGD
jgi:DnaJ-class molecular chaperone